MKRALSTLLAALIGIVMIASGCATSSNGGTAGGAADAGCSSLDPGLCEGGTGSPTDLGSETGIPGVTMTTPSYINGSELAEPSHSPPPCEGNSGSGFSVSIVDGAEGYATPQAAIDAFVADHQDYDTGATMWHIVYDGLEMTATSGRVSLDILGLPNANWIVDAGERC